MDAGGGAAWYLNLNGFFSLLFQFVMYVVTEREEGLYNLYFHACPNYQWNMFPLNFKVSIVYECTESGFTQSELYIIVFHNRLTLRRKIKTIICQPVKCHCPNSIL